jgi:hypothetical protein
MVPFIFLLIFINKTYSMSTLNVNNIGPISGNNVTVDGNLTATGTISGNISGSITNAATASYVAAANVDGTVANATSASYVAATNVDGTVTNALTASYAVSASYAPSSNPFPFVGNAEFSGSILVSGSILPNTDGVSSTSSFDLGSPTNAWKDIYVSNGTINFLDGAGNVQGTFGTGTNATVITGSLQVVPINPLTGFTTTNGTLLHKSYTTADCAFAMFDPISYSVNPQMYYGSVLNDGVSIVLPWDKKITAYSLVNNIPTGEPSTSTVVTLPPIYNAGYSTGETVTVYNLGKISAAYKDAGSIYLVGSMQGVTSTFGQQINGTTNQSYILSGSWGNYTQINLSNPATTSSIKLDPGQKATFEIVYWGTIFPTPSASINDFDGDGYQTNFTNINPSTTFTRYLFKGIENL